jgi:thioredoxin-like negative regulator of GroEL
MRLSAPLALRTALAAAVVAVPAAANDEWVRIRSPHFEVLTDAGEAPAREAARRLERLRDVFLDLFPARETTERPITLLILENRGRFSSLVPRARQGREVAGFFQGGRERDYAVLHLSPRRARPFAAAEHEYAHLVLNRSLRAQPVWVAEGLAEVLSDAVFEGGEAKLGATVAEHEAVVERGPGLPLGQLLRIRYDSPEYLGGRESEMVYAQSWALARWVIHRHDVAGLRSFLDTLGEGRDPSRAFVEVFGDLARAEATLREVPAGPLFRVTLESRPDAPLAMDRPTRADVEQRLGDLVAQGGDSKAARAHLERALKADPEHVAARCTLGDLLMRQGQWDAARRELERALEIEPGDPVVMLRLTRLRRSEALSRGAALAPEVEDQMIADLERVVAAAPQLYEAAVLLAELRPEPYAHRIALLEPLFDQQPERTAIAQVLSSLHVKRRDLAAARDVLERGRAAARDPSYRHLCEHLLARLEGFEAQTAEVEGLLVHLGCRPDGSLSFTIVADPASVELEAPSTQSFFVHTAEGTAHEHELLCGAQEVPVVARYRPSGGSGTGVDGELLWIALGEGSDR